MKRRLCIWLLAATAPVAAQDAESLIPESIEVIRDVVYATVPAEGDGAPIELAMDAAFPNETDGGKLPAVVYLHGGGWAFGDKSDGLPMAVAMATGGYLSVTVEYRLTNRATYPAAVHDCKAAIRFLRANADELGIDPDRIGVWGHSAGGHLSALLGTSAGVAELEGTLGPADVDTSVRCVVSIAGPADLSRAMDPRGRGMVNRWLGADDADERERRAEMASPVTHVDPSDAPCLAVHGTNDRLVPIFQSRLLHDALQDAGVESEFFAVEGDGHLVLDTEAYRRIAAFFDRHLGGAAERELVEVLREFARARGVELAGD